MPDVYDLTVIGGGPTGLFAAYYSGFRGLRTKIIDSQPDLGGQITALYPDKYIFDVGGFPKVLGKDLVRNLIEQAGQYGPTICLNVQVQRVEDAGDKLLRLVTDGGEHLTRVTLITAGIGAFTPKIFNRPEFDRYAGRGLHYAVRNREDFRDKRVLVIGGGDSALDWALNLVSVARQIILIHRRDQFRAHVDSVERLMGSTARVLVYHELKEIHGSDHVEGATIFHNKTKEETTLEVDAVLAFLGLISNLGPIREWGLAIHDDSIVVDTKMETNRPGVYAAGDIVAYPGKLKLIATGFGEAATAVNNAATYINPEAKVFPGHSSALVDREKREATAAGAKA